MSAKVRPKVTRLKRKRRLLTWMAAGKETTAQLRPVLGPISREALEIPVGTPKGVPISQRIRRMAAHRGAKQELVAILHQLS